VIKTDRQYAVTQRQLSLLEDALLNPPAPSADVHPLIAQAEQDAIREQASELRTEVEEYEGLREGRIPAPSLNDLADLPRNLIRARLAKALSQGELADRLHIAEQQIQRYEANLYTGASLARLREVAAALDQPAKAPAETDGPDASTLVRRLTELGLDRAVARRLVPPERGAPGNVAESAALAARALGIDADELVHREPTAALAGTGARFKVSGSANPRRTNAYAAYAHTLAAIVAKATMGLVNEQLPDDPTDINAAAGHARGAVSFTSLLEYCWLRGIVVLPLADAAAFHAAYWRVDQRHVVVLKQRTNSADRWVFDLAHELCHAVDAEIEDLSDSLAGVVDDEDAPGWSDDPDEQRANNFAGVVVLGTEADALARLASNEAQGKVSGLKWAVPAVARKAGVPAGALANYMAFRLRRQNVNWWPTAAGLQDRSTDPWRIARDALLARLDFSALDQQERILLVDALSEWGRA